MAIPNKTSKTPTTIKHILNILVNSKSKSVVVTVDESVEEELPLEDVLEVLDILDVLDVFALLRFISTAANV